jgi:hypothetical protein
MMQHQVQRVVWRRDQHCAHATGNKRRKWMQVSPRTENTPMAVPKP